jgi:hypothetical protein
MSFKIIVLIVLAVILYCLGSGLFYLVREGVGSRKLVIALTWRIVLSLCLFAFILISYLLGWVTPHAVFAVPN